MKVVVFAQTPPPVHGQSLMVELLVQGLAKNDFEIEIFHVNAQFATASHDIGKFRFGKVFRLFGYCLKALWFRFRRSAVSLYYVPAPPVKVPLYRDWLILIFLKPFFHHFIFHWEAAGLGEWIQTQPRWMQRLTRMALSRHDMSICLGRFDEKDVAWFHPQRTAIVPNGVPDPCPNFPEIQNARRERLQLRLAAWNSPEDAAQNPPVQIRVLFLSLCSKEKGLFDSIEGVSQANRLCRANQLPLEFHLTVAGPFPNADTESFFRQTLDRLGNPPTIKHIGFADNATKRKLLIEADIFCFPTFYYAENLSLVILEAMASGLPILTTKWRALPDLFPPNYPGLVDIQSPDQVASALFQLAARDDTEDFRARFLASYTAEKYLQGMAKAFKEAAAP